MIRSFFCSQLFRSPVILKTNISTRFYNSTTSVYQHSQDFFDVADELVDANLSKSKKTKPLVKGVKWDDEQKLRFYYASRKNLVQKFKHFFGCSEDHARAVIDENKKLMVMTLPKITEKIEILFQWNITGKTILENPWLLEVPKSELKFVQYR